MKNWTRVTVAVALCFAFVAGYAFAETPREEAAEHPRIANAIHEMEDAIAYMEAAPHDFGGHKAKAIEATRHAVEQLKLALAFRAKQDTKHGK
jgi:hypothetical protein